MAGLLEYWFAFAEHKRDLAPIDRMVLEQLVRCYRAAPPEVHPDFLTSLADDSVVRPVTELTNRFSHLADGFRILKPEWRRSGRYNLSAPARSAIDNDS